MRLRRSQPHSRLYFAKRRQLLSLATLCASSFAFPFASSAQSKAMMTRAIPSSGEALPVIGLVNWVTAGLLVVAWAWFLGHGRGKQTGRRALLTQDVGAIYYGSEARP